MNAPPVAALNVPTFNGMARIELRVGIPTFVVGRNGTGKSALMQRIRAQLSGRVVYVPGSRPSYFDAESLSITAAARRQLEANLEGWDRSADTRWRPISGTQRNEKAIHDLQSAEISFSTEATTALREGGDPSPVIERLRAKSSPVDRVNLILRQGNLPVQVFVSGSELMARRDDAVYSIAKMSDGERIALILAAEIAAAAPNTIFIIDEPELHLHRSIVVPLVSALLRERPDCAFIVSTHELDLPAAITPAAVLAIRDCRWFGEQVQAWDVDVLSSLQEIPEWLRVDVLGARRTTLFVEGVDSSLDQRLYSILFPSIAVVAKESCVEVQRSVAGLRGTEPMHRVHAFGLVDGDGMSQEEVDALSLRGVYALPSYSIESIYYSPESIRAVSEVQAGVLGVNPETLYDEANSAVITELQQQSVQEHLARRLASRRLKEAIMARLVTAQENVAETSEVSISVPSPYAEERSQISRHVESNDVASVISRYPVRESGVLNAIARALRFRSKADYEQALLTRAAADLSLQKKLRKKLHGLVSVLES